MAEARSIFMKVEVDPEKLAKLEAAIANAKQCIDAAEKSIDNVRIALRDIEFVARHEER